MEFILDCLITAGKTFVGLSLITFGIIALGIAADFLDRHRSRL